MSPMLLHRIHAFRVWPRHNAKTPRPVKGRAYTISPNVRVALDELYQKSGLAQEASIAFRPVAASAPPHEVREHILDFAMGTDAAALVSSTYLANRLADSMDGRSRPTLLMMTALADGTSSRAILWALPQEAGFQLNATQIRLVRDIFNHSSRLRKAAMFEGADRAADFQSGRIIDLQADGKSGTGADYWVDDFLDCELSLTGVMGTRHLAGYLRDGYNAVTHAGDKEQILSAIIAIRTSPRTRWSHKAVATAYLKGNAQNVFLSKIPTRDLNLQFSFDKSEFERRLNFYACKTANGIQIFAPFGVSEKNFSITGKQKRKVKVLDELVKEGVTLRNA